MLQPDTQHPDRMRRFDNSGQNTSDEEQEELPYDGKETINTTPDGPGSFEGSKDDDVAGGVVPVEQSRDKQTTSSTADKKKEKVLFASNQSDSCLSCPSPADIHQLLLRHFPQEELLQPDMLIQAETLPELSLLESGGSSASARCSTSTDSDHSKGNVSDSELHKSEEKKAASEGNGDSNTSSTADSMTLSSEGGGNSTVVDVSKQEQPEEDQKIPRVPLVRRRSFTDMKYGQGQVHYPHPDFSKISSKLKIPKGPSGPARPAPNAAGAMHRTRSSPDVLEVISRVLEDSGQTSEHPSVLTDADRTPPAPAHRPQVNKKYNDLYLYDLFNIAGVVNEVRTETSVCKNENSFPDTGKAISRGDTRRWGRWSSSEKGPYS